MSLSVEKVKLTRDQYIEYCRNQAYWFTQLAEGLQEGKTLEQTAAWAIDAALPELEADWEQRKLAHEHEQEIERKEPAA